MTMEQLTETEASRDFKFDQMAIRTSTIRMECRKKALWSSDSTCTLFGPFFEIYVVIFHFFLCRS